VDTAGFGIGAAALRLAHQVLEQLAVHQAFS
jgi:hypothetical protein